MKLLTSVFVTCFFFVPSLLANVDIVDLGHALTGSKKATNFRGSGTYYNKAEKKRGNYDVTLKITDIGNNKLHFYWEIAFDDKTEIYSIIVKADHELLTVYSPKDTESLDDLATYIQAGWGYSVVKGMGTKRKVLAFLNYDYVDGNKYDEHFVVQRGRGGKLTIDSSGTLGNDKDGMVEIWSDQVQAVD